MEWVEYVRATRHAQSSQGTRNRSTALKVIQPVTYGLLNTIRNNVKVGQMLAGKMSIHPTAPQVRIRKCKIPRRPDLAPEGLPASEATGTLKAEWQHYGGWFKKPPVNRSDGFVDPKERVILYAHGGLYCIGAPQTHRGITWRLGYSAKARILSIDYRLAPQHVYPAALHDMVSAFFYLIDPPAGQPRYRPEQIMFSGDSAGGNLSVATCMWLRDHGQGLPMPGGLLLLSPWLDLSHSVPSYLANGAHDYLPEKSEDPKFIHKNRLHYYIAHNKQLFDPLISPIFADEVVVRPFPPTMIHIGDAERIRDDGIVFQAKNKSSPIHVEMYEDMVHVFQLLSLVDRMAVDALHRMGAFADAIWSNQKWENDFVWVRRNRTIIPLTKPMSIVEHGKHISKSIGRWTDNHQSVYEAVIKPLVDYESCDEQGPDSAFSEQPMNSFVR